MCGIIGYFNLSLEAEERLPLLRRMCGTIAHRGPDDEGYYADDRIGLGVRRLSIIDLGGGHQPISNEDGSKHIAYNGEVYNFGDLRHRLESQGHRFSTASDTEVILHQYEQEGPACVHRLNGMFAFAIWDRTAGTLFLARDRMGIKPLYYYWDGRCLLFASEIKALLASGYVARELNLRALWDYLTFRYVPQPETIWENVYKLLPGHTLTISAGRPEPVLERYWDIPYDDDTVALRGETEYAQEFERLFLDAVRLRLIADVPVGILLSGGLDSSSVAAAVAEIHNASLSSFSVAFRDSPATDELPFARKVAGWVGTDHNEIVIGEREFCDFLPQFVRYTDEPLADLASVPLYYVSSLARQKVKVVLSGEGGDEVLGGYHDMMILWWDVVRQFQRLPTWLRRDVAVRVARLFGGRMVERVRKANTPPSKTAYLNSDEKRALFVEVPPFEDSMARVQAELRRTRTRVPLHQVLYVYCQSWLVEDLLMKADKMTMANSIELRVPFLDYRLVEWAAHAPSWVKVNRDGRWRHETKRVLRRFASTRLPGEIITRSKQGFPVPVYDWLDNRLKPWATELLAPSDALLYRWLRPDQVHRQLQLGTGSGTLIEKHRLWHLLILELWLREWQPR
jgi:asparagine synthase (glutamine-hydrolysing)